MPKRLNHMVLDRRKRLSRPMARRDPSTQGYLPTTPLTPGPYSPGSGLSTRYHSAESIPTVSHRAIADTVATLAPVIGGAEGDNRIEIDSHHGEKEESDWPDVLIVTGLEECESSIQTKLIEMVKTSARERQGKQGMILVWIRPDAAIDNVPPWLVSSIPTTRRSRRTTS